MDGSRYRDMGMRSLTMGRDGMLLGDANVGEEWMAQSVEIRHESSEAAAGNPLALSPCLPVTQGHFQPHAIQDLKYR